ncbi:MAG: hypothetical protein MAG451_01162 [Anaerolineales bacterium]|nr:hypothetical protein [Anaerolineales bacterium]
MDVTLVLLRQLIEPHVGVLSDHHDLRHPVAVRTEPLGLDFQPCKVDHPRRPPAEEAHLLLFFDEIQAAQQTIEVAAQHIAPLLTDMLELTG